MNPPEPARPTEIIDYRSAMLGMIDRPYLKSQRHRDAVRFCDYTFASESLRDFVGKLLRKAAKMGIPLYCESVSFDVAFVVHGRLKRELHPRQWEVIGHIGTEISQQYQLGVTWCGPMMGSCWLSGAPAEAIRQELPARGEEL